MNMSDVPKAREAILAELKRRFDAKDKEVKPGPKGFVGAGRMECPVCGTGHLVYSRATNGHVMARCSEGCVGWME